MKKSNKYLIMGCLWFQFEQKTITFITDPDIFERAVNHYIAAHEKAVEMGFCDDVIPTLLPSDFESHLQNEGFFDKDDNDLDPAGGRGLYSHI